MAREAHMFLTLPARHGSTKAPLLSQRRHRPKSTARKGESQDQAPRRGPGGAG